MPQDTFYTNPPTADTLLNTDTAPVKIGTYVETPPETVLKQGPDNYVTGIIILGIFFLVFLSPLWLRFLYIRAVRFFRKTIQEPILEKRIPKTYENKWVTYKNWLQYYNPYYRRLPENQKERFLIRTLEFMASKKFHFKDLEEEEKMPLLISAAAVQLTFGLKEFRLDYFKNIYVLSQHYHYGLYHVPFEGHINSDGIFLSWSNFDRAFADYTDGNNVGLHEMAHALTYVNFITADGTDEHFKSQFFTFTKTGRRIFDEMQAGRSNFLGEYAASDYNEFWAVSIEFFFERSLELQYELPDLYKELVLLLNQDPIHPGVFTQPVD